MLMTGEKESHADNLAFVHIQNQAEIGESLVVVTNYRILIFPYAQEELMIGVRPDRSSRKLRQLTPV